MTIVSDAIPSFEDIFDAYVEANTEDRERDDRLHPSSLFFCDRRVVYDFRLTPREETTGSKRPLLVGKVLHVEMQAALEMAVGKTIRRLYIEGHVDDPDTLIRGSFDALVQYMDGTWELLELKSANSKSVYWNRKRGDAKDDHILQGMSYIDAIRSAGFRYSDMLDAEDGPTSAGDLGDPVFEHPPIPDLERLRVIYFDKDKHDIQEFHYRYTEQWRREELEPHIEKLKRYRAEGVLPLRLPKDSWQCRSVDGIGEWCPYYDRCWNVDEEGVELG